MNKFSSWFYNFMQGRYGFDQLGRSLLTLAIVLWIFGIIVGIFTNVVGFMAALLSTILNWAGLFVLALMAFRMFSRNTEKRRAENFAYIDSRTKRKGKKGNKNGNKNRNGNSGGKSIFSKQEEDAQETHTYLACAFCGQQMRVPKGKGKIAVKCPSCGEKTIINS